MTWVIIYSLHYQVLCVHRIELEEIGPHIDLTLRRSHLASDDLFRSACKQVKGPAWVEICFFLGWVFIGTSKNSLSSMYLMILLVKTNTYSFLSSFNKRYYFPALIFLPFYSLNFYRVFNVSRKEDK